MQYVDINDGLTGPYKIAIDDIPDKFDEWVINNPQLNVNARLFIGLMQTKGLFVDVGANIGTISIPLAKSGPKVIAIEPVAHNCEKLRASVTANALAGRVTLHEAAASNKKGSVVIEGDQAWARVSSKSALGSLVSRLKGKSTPCFTLDGHRKITNCTGDLGVKIDVEGHELQVLQGMSNILKTKRPYVLFESIADPNTSDNADCKKLLAAFDYDLFYYRWPVLAPVSVDDLQIPYVADFLAIPQERLSETEPRIKSVYLEIRDLTEEEIQKIVAEHLSDPAPDFHAHGERLRAKMEVA